MIVAPEAVGADRAAQRRGAGRLCQGACRHFSTPEYRQIEYAEIGPQDVAGQVPVTDAMIAQDYAAHQADYNVPEKRDIQQIEFANEADAKAARAKIDKGKTFDAAGGGEQDQAGRSGAGHADARPTWPIRPVPTPPSPCRSTRSASRSRARWAAMC